MTALGEAIGAVREALRLADDVKRVGDTIKDVSKELRDHDRRITRLEAKWETAMDFSAGRSRVPRELPDGT